MALYDIGQNDINIVKKKKKIHKTNAVPRGRVRNANKRDRFIAINRVHYNISCTFLLDDRTALCPPFTSSFSYIIILYWGQNKYMCTCRNCR